MSAFITKPIRLLQQAALKSQRRFNRSRPGSVLILVVALLVILALLGTAYISTTRIDRYTTGQNAVNTQADLLLQGIINAATGSVVNGLYGSNGGNNQYRPPTQEMPIPAIPVGSVNGYKNYDSAVSNSFQAERVPVAPAIPISSYMQAKWQTISWPLFQDTTGDDPFDSPFESSINTYGAGNKGAIECYPAYKSAGGEMLPGMIFYVPSGQTVKMSTGATISGPTFLTPTGQQAGPLTAANYNSYVSLAADADGDGIADSGLWKLPVGVMDGITYYAAVRIIDNNSAVNASSAWTMAADPASTFKVDGTAYTNNFGFFRSGIGLLEMLNSGNAAMEMTNLNNYRFYPPATSANLTPVDDTATSRPDVMFTSQGEAIDTQLTRRSGYPGYNTTSIKYQWMGFGETAAMAYDFCLRNPNSSPSLLETFLPNEVYSYANWRNQAYATTAIGGPGIAGSWYGDLFDFQPNTTLSPPTNFKPLRSLLVGNNAVSNAVPSRLGNVASGPPTWNTTGTYQFGDWVEGTDSKSYVSIYANNIGNNPVTSVGPAGIYENIYWAQVPWTSVPVKASINTAGFNQLWLSFCQMMTDAIVPPVTTGQPSQWQPPQRSPAPAVNSGIEPQLPMFRSSIRDNTQTIGPGYKPLLTQMQMVELRAALAAVNAMDLRDGDDDVTSRHVILADTTGAAKYDVEVYGTEAQPYIGEVLVDVADPLNPAKNYIAVELVNPYPRPITITSNWKFASVPRPTTPAPPNLVLTPITGPMLPVPFTIPAASAGKPGLAYITGANPAPAGFTAPTTNVLTVTGLEACIGNELAILKPRRFDGTTTKSTDPTDTYDEATNIADLVPVDQIDMTGVTTLTPLPARLHYRRGTDPSTMPSYTWNFVYPGPYNPNAAGVSATDLREAFQVDVAAPAPGNFGGFNSGVPSVAQTTPTYDTAPLQLSNLNMAGPNPALATGNSFPIGGFARNVDLLEIPFIGAYRIRTYSATQVITQNCIELNSVSMDASQAWDTTLGVTGADVNGTAIQVPQSATINNPVAPSASAFVEQIGRFCPVGDSGVTPGGMVITPTQDFLDDATVGPANWHYHWTRKLFDYFTVQNTIEQYLPNVDPTPANTMISPSTAVYPSIKPPQLVTKTLDTDGVEGLININTAPWRVLATLPFVPVGTDKIRYDTPTVAAPVGTITVAADNVDDNVNIAMAIVAYRNVNGPFKSIYDLYKVPAIAMVNEQLWKTTEPLPAQGYFSPPRAVTAAQPDSPRYDFEERFLLLNQISNLITVRSDTFTCYVMLQGWRGVGSALPTLAVQRRAAFIVDRTKVTPSNSSPFTFHVSAN